MGIGIGDGGIGAGTGRDVGGKHPTGLYLLSAVEFWERFSFYGLQANLIFFLLWHLSVDKSAAYGQFAAFAALVYLCPIIGGLAADRWVGARNAVVAGALLLLSGHSLLAWLPAQTHESLITADGVTLPLARPELYPASGDGADGEAAGRHVRLDGRDLPVLAVIPHDGDDGLTDLRYRRADGGEATLTGRLERRGDGGGIRLFHLALSLVAAGVGMLKPNISTLVGRLYGQRHAARDQGFLVFYLGINAGGLLGSVVCGWLAIRAGWEWGFGIAGFGMALALLTLRLGRRHLPPPEPLTGTTPVAIPGTAESGAADASSPRRAVPPLALALTIGGTLAVSCWTVIGSADTVSHFLDAAALLAVGYLLWIARRMDAQQRRNLVVLGVLMLASVLFWALFYQTPASLNVFTSEWIDLRVGPLNVPAPVLQFTEQAVVMLMALPVAGLWRWLDGRRRLPGAPMRFAMGIGLMGLGFLVLIGGIALAAGAATGGNATAGAKVALAWLVILYALQGTGELFLSPTGLSAMSRLAPPGTGGLMLGLWFLSTAYAQKLAALVSQATVSAGDAVHQIDAYTQVYRTVGLYACGFALLLALAAPLLRRLAPA